MTDTHAKKTNWLAIVSVLLGLLLISQTVGFIYLLNKKEKPEPYSQTTAANMHQPAWPSRNLLAHHPSAYYQDPTAMFDDMHSSMEQMFGGFMAGLPSMMARVNQNMGIDSMPLVDLEEKDNAYVVQVDMPGLDKDKIDITVRGEILTIQGMRETVSQNQSGSFYTQERSYGSFSRSLRLPGPVDETAIKAEYKDGVLAITLPKASKEGASKKVAVS